MQILEDFFEWLGNYFKFNTLQLTITLGRRAVRSESVLNLIIQDVCNVIRRQQEADEKHQHLQSVCEGVANLYSPSVFFIFRNSNVSSQDMTAILLGYKDLGRSRFEKSILNWKIPLPGKSGNKLLMLQQDTGKEDSLASSLSSQTNYAPGKHQIARQEGNPSLVNCKDEDNARILLPSSLSDLKQLTTDQVQGTTKNYKDKTNLEQKQSRKEEGAIKFLHLTDVHLDLKYKIGEEINCPTPLCCRQNQEQNHLHNQEVRDEQVKYSVKDVKPTASSLSATFLGKYIRSTSKVQSLRNSSKAGAWGEVEGDCDCPFKLAEEVLIGIKKTLESHSSSRAGISIKYTVSFHN